MGGFSVNEKERMMTGFRRFLYWPALFLATCSPLLLRAQFQEPTKEDLQMTADPKAPGESAVYLYREEVTDQTNATSTYYERIKILTEQGKEMATERLFYEAESAKIAGVEGRTIHPDGTIIPLTDKPAELVDFKIKGFQRNTLVVTFPGVDVGSIVECRIRIKYVHAAPSPTWMIQQSHFVHKAHYVFKTINGLVTPGWSSKLPATANGVTGKNGLYTLDINDIPAIPEEDWMPPLNSVKWRVSFFFSEYRTKDEFWKEVGKDWGTIVYNFVNPTGGLKKVAAAMVAPGDTQTQKAEKIYAAVMNLENTNYTREKTKAERKKEKIKDIHSIEDIWKQKSGSSDEIAFLFIALCRAAGLDVDPMIVADRSRAIFDQDVLYSRQLDDFTTDVIAVGKLDGKEVYLDPGEKMCPFGTLHWKHTLAAGFRLVDKKGVVSQTPAADYMQSKVDRFGNLTIDETGAVTGLIRFVLTGQMALYWRQLALQNDQDEIKKQFNESVRDEVPDGVQAEFDHFLALDDYNSNLMAIVRVTGTVATATGKRFFLPGLFFQSHAKHPFVAQEKRVTPVDVHYAKIELDDVTYHLPPGYTLESLPQTSNVSWSDHALLKIGAVQHEDSVEVARSLAYNFTILDPKEYPDLHDFYQKVAVADQQQIVLTHISTAAGKKL
jgi:hypothetical protein